jgi:hypothetical protein
MKSPGLILKSYRDGLLLALVSLRPMRRRSIAALTVSRHLEFDDEAQIDWLDHRGAPACVARCQQPALQSCALNAGGAALCGTSSECEEQAAASAFESDC